MSVEQKLGQRGDRQGRGCLGAMMGALIGFILVFAYIGWESAMKPEPFAGPFWRSPLDESFSGLVTLNMIVFLFITAPIASAVIGSICGVYGVRKRRGEDED